MNLSYQNKLYTQHDNSILTIINNLEDLFEVLDKYSTEIAIRSG